MEKELVWAFFLFVILCGFFGGVVFDFERLRIKDLTREKFFSPKATPLVLPRGKKVWYISRKGNMVRGVLIRQEGAKYYIRRPHHKTLFVRGGDEIYI